MKNNLKKITLSLLAVAGLPVAAQNSIGVEVGSTYVVCTYCPTLQLTKVMREVLVFAKETPSTSFGGYVWKNNETNTPTNTPNSITKRGANVWIKQNLAPFGGNGLQAARLGFDKDETAGTLDTFGSLHGKWTSGEQLTTFASAEVKRRLSSTSSQYTNLNLNKFDLGLSWKINKNYLTYVSYEKSAWSSGSSGDLSGSLQNIKPRIIFTSSENVSIALWSEFGQVKRYLAQDVEYYSKLGLAIPYSPAPTHLITTSMNSVEKTSTSYNGKKSDTEYQINYKKFFD